MTEIERPLIDLTMMLAERLEVAVILAAIDEKHPAPQILYVNKAFEHLTGYTLDDVRGESPRLLQGPQTSLATRKRISMALRRGERHQATMVNYKKTGEPYHCAIDISPLKASDGTVIAAVSLSWEVQRRPGRRSRDLTKPL